MSWLTSCLTLYLPLQVLLCIWFLCFILGWGSVVLPAECSDVLIFFRSAFVGLAVMVILFPLPRYVARCPRACRLRVWRRWANWDNKCSLTNLRRQTLGFKLLQKVSQAGNLYIFWPWLYASVANIYRSVKMFAWENMVKARPERKRKEELLWIRKRQLLQLLSNMVKWGLAATHPVDLLTFFASFVIPIAVMLATYSTYVSIWTMY